MSETYNGRSIPHDKEIKDALKSIRYNGKYDDMRKISEFAGYDTEHFKAILIKAIKEWVKFDDDDELTKANTIRDTLLMTYGLLSVCENKKIADRERLFVRKSKFLEDEYPDLHKEYHNDKAKWDHESAEKDEDNPLYLGHGRLRRTIEPKYAKKLSKALFDHMLDPEFPEVDEYLDAKTRLPNLPAPSYWGDTQTLESFSQTDNSEYMPPLVESEAVSPTPFPRPRLETNNQPEVLPPSVFHFVAVSEIETELKALRSNNTKNINEIFVLTWILGCNRSSNRIKKFRIICLIRSTFSDEQEAETLLVALNLHDSYDHIEEIGVRRQFFYNDKLSHENLANPTSTLHKREDKLITRLATHVINTIKRSETEEDVIQKLLQWHTDEVDVLRPGKTDPQDEQGGSNTNGSPHTGCTAAKTITESRPLQPSGFFIGRDKKLADIKKELVGNAKLLLLNGMGGIGKTEVCRKLFHEAINSGLNEVRKVGWITFIGNVERSFFRQFNEIDNFVDKPKDYLAQVEKYINVLGGELLLFIDNANDISNEDSEWLLRLGCKIIMTTRNERVERMMPIEIERLSIEDCRILYRWHSGTSLSGDDSYYGSSNTPDSSPNQDLDDILELAQRHTLAVELLAKTQRANGRTTKQMLTLLMQGGFSLRGIGESISYTHNPELLESDRNEEIFIRQFSIVFNIAGIGGEKLRIMQLFSLLASEPVETDIAKLWIGLPDLDAINGLVNSGWLVSGEFITNETENKRGFGFSMHPLISSVIQHQAMPAYDISCTLVKAVAETISLEKEDEFLTKIPYLNHANSVIDLVSVDDEIYVQLINKTSVILYNIPLLTRASEVLVRAIEIVDRAFDENSLSKASCYHNLAYVRFLQREYDPSLILGSVALKIRKRVLGSNTVETAQTINNLGRAYDGKCDFENALKCFRRSISILNDAVGRDDPMTVHLSNNIGVTYFHMGDYAKAHEFFTKVLDSLILSLGEAHADTARAYHNVSSAAYCLGQYGEALNLALKARELYENSLGKEHNYVAEVTHNIACICQEIGDNENALKWHRKAIAIREKLFGTNSPDAAESYNGIASVLSALRRYDEALPYYKKALAINEEKLGDTNDDTGEIYNGLADLHRETGCLQEALTCIDRAIDIYGNALGENHPYMAEALNSKGGIYFKMQDYDSALTYYSQALEIRRISHGDNHTSTAESIFNIGEVSAELGEYEKALNNYFAALRVFDERYDSSDHGKIVRVLESIRKVYLAAENDEAHYEAWLVGKRHPTNAE